MKPILNQLIIDKYILDGFGEIPNPPTQDEMKGLIRNKKLTLEKVRLWSLFGGDLLIKGIYGNTILQSASSMGQLDIIEYVLNKGFDIDYLNDYKQTPLMYASEFGQVGVINLLLDCGVNINVQDMNGWSSLHYACEWNRLECIKLLVDRGIDIHLKGYYNALYVAKSYNHQQIVDYLTPYYNK